VRRNMRPPPREEGRIIKVAHFFETLSILPDLCHIRFVSDVYARLIFHITYFISTCHRLLNSALFLVHNVAITRSTRRAKTSAKAGNLVYIQVR